MGVRKTEGGEQEGGALTVRAGSVVLKKSVARMTPTGAGRVMLNSAITICTPNEQVRTVPEGRERRGARRTSGGEEGEEGSEEERELHGEQR